MNTQATILIQSLGWALLHSLWQVPLIYCCLRVVLKVSGNITSRLKYHLSVTALVGSFVWFINTCIVRYQRMQGVTIHVTQSGADPAATKSYSLNALTTNAYDSTMLYNITAGIEPYFPFLVSLYILGISFLLVKLIVNLVQIRTLKTKGLTNVDAFWADWAAQWQDRLDISRKVQIFFSKRISIPMTMGTFKPVILLPFAAVNNLTTDQLEAILLHELAHIKRHDYLLNIIQTVVETILFFNPFIWLISRIIRKEREHCCDDVVLSYMSTPLPYARALAELEVSKHHTLALAATGNKHQLLTRIKRIMEMKKKPVNYTQFGLAAIVITALIVSIAWFTPAIAQTQKIVTKDKKGGTTVTTTKSTGQNGSKSVTQTIVIDNSRKGSNGVHPDDVGNAEDIRNQVKEAMESVDMDKVGEELSKVMEDIDWTSIGKEVQIAMSKVDLDRISDEAATAMAKIDWDKINAEISQATKDLKDVDLEEIRKEVRKAKVEVEKARTNAHKEMIEARANADKEMREARAVAIHKRNGNVIMATSASVNGNRFDDMLKEMEDEGLINISKGYKVELEDGNLYINGKKQSASVTRKYKKHFVEGSHTTIKGDHKNKSIDVSITK